MAEQQQEQLRGWQKYKIILVLGSLIAIGPFSIDTYLPAFKMIASDFGVDTNAIGITLTTYFIGIALGQLAYGPLMDKYGRRRPLIIALILYIVTSVLCAFAWNLESLAVVRFFMALGGCAGMVASKAVVRDYFDRDQVADVLSTLMLIMGIAPIIAPSVGSLIIGFMPWEAIFIVLAVFASLMLFNIIYILPESRKPDAAVSLQPLQVTREYGEIYKNRDFLIFSTARGFMIGALLAYVASAPHVLIEIFGISQKSFGILFGLNAAGLIAGSQINRFFLRRFTLLQVTYSAVIAMVLSTAGALIFCAVAGQYFWVVYPALFLMLTSIGFLNPNVTALAMEPFKEQAGKASALLGAASMVFGATASWLVAQVEGETVVPLLIVLTICAVATMIIIEVFRKKFAKGYAYAKAFYNSPYMVRKRTKTAE